jgi:hypothetical protein
MFFMGGEVCRKWVSLSTFSGELRKNGVWTGS